MRIIKPYLEVLTPIDTSDVMRHLELCARTCYKSEDMISKGSAEKLVSALIRSGHEAAVEHFGITVRFVCDRGVSHELVRHRLASYCQESTRYCNYANGKFDGELTFIAPCFWSGAEYAAEYGTWRNAMQRAEDCYMELIAAGARPEQARSVLPNSLKTEVVMTANIREWRHFLKLRTSAAAHPQIRELAVELLHQLQVALPVCFSDIEVGH